ncbi:sporulation membrane protein YtaF [Pallidibacillus pasinlerensis]|uniref:Sporulation membrane protein YtaF n=1 Tax=Pallidibacillus pasinlerensis TaxID=2703818 RepID=A0ABX0A8K6_9BACI|nr:sporulation membrane protein YtaF [Pallidibacillus pasinlerensis]NCU18849.1 sporulation membrane protein YtaF [Pallidibacillus pasinlerensis]
MLEMYSLLLLAFAVSMDSFNVGFTYGMRRVSISVQAILIIALCSSISLYFAEMIGSLFGGFLTPEVSQTIGGSILILLGVWALYQFFRTLQENGKSDRKSLQAYNEKVLLKFEIKSVGIVIHILKKPMTADLDKSGTINGFEAVLLGAALSLDSFGVGISASMLAFSPLILAVAVGVMSGIFLSAGLLFGKSMGENKWAKHISILPGLILIFIGIWRL